MGVERDDGRPRPRALSGAAQLPQQVQVAAVEPVEDADGHDTAGPARASARRSRDYDHAIARRPRQGSRGSAG
jgi:hypothetical protein